MLGLFQIETIQFSIRMQRLQILINLADRRVQVGMERILKQILVEEFGMPGYTKFFLLSSFLFSNFQELFSQEEKLDHWR